MIIKEFKKKCNVVSIPISKIRKIESILKKKGGQIYIVGGAVRSLVLQDRKCFHPDLVCNLPIEEIIKTLKKEMKISFVGSGIEYGSIVISDDLHKFDLTSLRKDIKSFGRHAEIQFTNNIQEDSLRRDFSINAIYCDTKGKLIDPQKGIDELISTPPKIRFIGSAEDRIKEDYLRILRFLRFSLSYSKKFNDKDFLICKKFTHKIKLLSFERRLSEIKKILILENIESKVILKKIQKLIEISLECKIDINNFERMCFLERENSDISFARRIKFLTRGKNLKKKTFLSKMNKDLKKRLITRTSILQFSRVHICMKLLKFDSGIVLDELYFYYASNKIDLKSFLYLKSVITNFDVSKYPLNGKDLLDLGFVKSKELGNAQSNIKKWWIKNDCKPKKKECIEYARKRLPSGIGR
ncbi:MAG: hypothetical protein ACJ0GH_01090 [Alphaproteobacteria bacterium]